MKILLRNITTGFFYAGGNQWTPHVESAHDFETGLNALQYSSKVGPKGVEFVYVQTDSANGFVLPAQSTYRPEQRV